MIKYILFCDKKKKKLQGEGEFLRYPRDQWRKVNFCPLGGAELWENRGKAQAGMAWGGRWAKPPDVGEFSEKH